MAAKRARRRNTTWWELELQRYAASGELSPKTRSAVIQANTYLATVDAVNDSLKRLVESMTAERQPKTVDILRGLPVETDRAGAVRTDLGYGVVENPAGEIIDALRNTPPFPVEEPA